MNAKEKKSKLTQGRLQDVLDYNPITGSFSWKEPPHPSASNISIGGVAGAVENNGYIRICIDRERHQAHRLAWLYVHGHWPESKLDHIDTNKVNNAISNLRLASPSQNSANRKVGSDNKLGIKGVRLHECGRYVARIMVRGEAKYLGLYPTKEAAFSAYEEAAVSAFGEYARVSR